MIIIMVSAAGWKDHLRRWEKKLSKAARMTLEQEPELKVFTPANSNLRVMESYEGTLGDDYWDGWTKNPYRSEKGSMISHDEVRKVAKELNFSEVKKVEEIAIMLEHGADIGVEGEGRWPSQEANNASVYQFGSRVADALQTGVKDGILYGPLKREELPWEPKCSHRLQESYGPIL